MADQLANLGMEAIHPGAGRGLRQTDIPLRVRNTFDREGGGTLICGAYVSDTPRVEIVTGVRQAQALQFFEQDMVGVKGYDESVVTPHASGLAAMLRPREAALNLREMAQLYPIYGNFGFYDAVEPKSGKVAYKYLALDQSMLFLGLANTVKPHLVQRYFAADPDIRRALPVVRSENFFK